MIRFNIDTLEAVSKSDPKLLRLTLLHFFKNRPMQKRIRYTHYNRNTMFGKSYLINPDKILNDFLTDPLYVAQYIRLAARRSYLFYKTYGIAYLDLSSYPDIDISSISHNPLLSVVNNQIHFKY